jgi:hypothetical protein
LYNCHGVTKIADGLKVDGNVDVVDTPLSRLPLAFRIKGILTLIHTNIKGVPRDMNPQGGVVVDEDASPSLQALAARNPVKFVTSNLPF